LRQGASPPASQDKSSCITINQAIVVLLSPAAARAGKMHNDYCLTR
jgi:hypothetical protein